MLVLLKIVLAVLVSKESYIKKAHPPTIIIYSKRPLELLHLDLFWPPSFDSLGGRKHCLVIVDDYARYTTTGCG